MNINIFLVNLILAILHIQRCFSQTTTSIDGDTNVTVFIVTTQELGSAATTSEMGSGINLTTAPETTTVIVHDITVPTGDGTVTAAFSGMGSTIFGTTPEPQTTEGMGSGNDSNTTFESVTQDGTTGEGSGFNTTDSTTVQQNFTEDGSGDDATSAVSATDTFTTIEPGSGTDISTPDDSSGATTPEFGSGTESTSGPSEMTTDDSNTVTLVSTTPMLSDMFSTEPTTDGDTTMSENTTAAIVVVATPGVFPWYLIVIIIMGIIIFILLIIVCWKYCFSAGKSDEFQSDTMTKHFSNQHVDAMKLKQLPIITGEQIVAKPVSSLPSATTTTFVSERSNVHDPTRSVRKREVRPRIEPKTPPSSDEGFIEPLVKKELIIPPVKRAPPRKSNMPSRKAVPTQRENLEDWNDSYRMPQNTQSFILPPLVQTALVSKTIGDSLTDNAMAQRRALQRSEIERHRNKQRLKRQRSRIADEAYKTAQRDIDKVLLSQTPPVFQNKRARKRVHKTRGHADFGHGGAKDPDMQLLVGNMQSQGRFRDQNDEIDRETTSSQANIPPHEATITKMTKLLEDAYALLAPALQRNMAMVTPQQPAYPDQFGRHPSTAAATPFVAPAPSAVPQQEPMVFTRTQPPLAFLPNNDVSNTNRNDTNTSYTQSATIRADDSQSILWTPYRAYDEIARLQAEDPLFNGSSTLGSSSTPSYLNYTNPKVLYTPADQIHHNNWAGSLNQTIPGGIPPVPVVAGYPQFQNSRLDTASRFNLPQVGPIEQAAPPGQHEAGPVSGYESPSSLVQSIKDTLTRLTRSPTPVQDLTSVHSAVPK